MRLFLSILIIFTCISCQKKPESVLQKYFEVSNNVVNGDTTEIRFLQKHLSKYATKQMDSIPLLMQYSLLFLTKNGILVNTRINGKKVITKDSIILDIDLNYSDSSGINIQQAMVFEGNEWKLGVSAK